MKNCIVIGGGIIGLFSAYYLHQNGHSVKVIDATDMSNGCSYGNAGMIVPSHVIPLAQPGMIAKGIKWMFNSKSPFYVRPRLNSELISWGKEFKKSATQKHVNTSKGALLEMSLLSKLLYQDLAHESSKFDYTEKGLLMLFQSEKVGNEEREAAKIAKELGLKVSYYDSKGLKEIEPNVSIDSIGGILYESDAHLDPNALMQFLKSHLENNGVEFITGAEISGFEVDRNTVKKCFSTDQEFEADHFIIAGGAWSPNLTKMLNSKLKLLPGKGYSFNIEKSAHMPQIPSILCEGKVAVTPLNDRIRFGGTMEITHVKDRKINMKRVKGIVETCNRFYPELNVRIPQEKDIWFGFRPCTPTGLPVISNHDNFQNLTIATGHAMMGLSMATGTGKSVAELVSEEATTIDLEKFNWV